MYEVVPGLPEDVKVGAEALLVCPVRARDHGQQQDREES